MIAALVIICVMNRASRCAACSEGSISCGAETISWHAVLNSRILFAMDVIKDVLEAIEKSGPMLVDIGSVQSRRRERARRRNAKGLSYDGVNYKVRRLAIDSLVYSAKTLEF